MKDTLMKRILSLVLTAMMVASLSTVAFAADTSGVEEADGSANISVVLQEKDKKKEADPAKAELVAYRKMISENKDALERLKNQISQLKSQITVLQHELKQSGVLTRENSSFVSEMSLLIKQQRLTVAAAREESKALREASKAEVKETDVEAAKSSLEAVVTAQENQTGLLEELREFLSGKLTALEEAAANAEEKIEE